MEKSKSPIRECLLYEYRLGNNAVIATQNICVAKGHVTAKRWFKSLRNGDFSLQEDPRSGRPMEIDLAKLKHVLESGSDKSIRNIKLLLIWT